MITIVDYGMGNLGSIQNMFKHIGAQSQLSGDAGEIDRADKLLLPGVGAFDAAILKIRERGLMDVLIKKATIDKIPVLGICLGMQLLTDSSEEGTLPGLGFIPGKTVRFSFPGNKTLKVPHMGWNNVNLVKENKLTNGLPEDSRFYFVHSYYVKTNDAAHVLGRTTHGLEFDSIINRENIFGAQFHPEKSHRFGMQILTNFAGI